MRRNLMVAAALAAALSFTPIQLLHLRRLRPLSLRRRMDLFLVVLGWVRLSRFDHPLRYRR
jgi:hypothetical protein